MGTDLHQETITNLRLGLNEAARAQQQPGGPVPWYAFSQTLILGFRRYDGTRYKTLPDVFVYRTPTDSRRKSRVLSSDGPPLLIIEVVSDATQESDLNLERGKGYSYARAGVLEYLLLDPTGEFLTEQIQGWRLVDGAYRPWGPNAEGRWQSTQIAASVAIEGLRAAVYTPAGVRQLREGEIHDALARRDAEIAALRRLIDQDSPQP